MVYHHRFSLVNYQAHIHLTRSNRGMISDQHTVYILFFIEYILYLYALCQLDVYALCQLDVYALCQLDVYALCQLDVYACAYEHRMDLVCFVRK